MKKVKNLSEELKREWSMREWGSWEDSGETDVNHIVSILKNSPKGKIKVTNEEQLKNVHASAWCIEDFDSDSETLRMGRAIAKFINW
jgi:hypothetical protein|tara:strand:- start:468 stop:728 length:261 start_codon:yes stop_codon:yes gene_type:complete